MTWAKLDDGFFRHPKSRAAGKDGRALFVAGLCWAAAHLTDGHIGTAELGLIAAEAEVRPGATVRRLVETGLWEACADGWRIHDFHDFNPTAQAALDKRRKRAEAGRIGGLKSRPPPSKPEAKVEANASANAQAKSKQKRTPSPLMTKELTSSDVLTTERDPADDDDQPIRHALAGAIVATLAERDLVDRQAQSHLQPVADPVTWANAAAERRRLTDSATIAALVDAHPDLTPDQLADLMQPPPVTSTNGAGRRTDDRYDDQQKALLAHAENGARKIKELLEEPVDPDANLDRVAALKAELHPGEEW